MTTPYSEQLVQRARHLARMESRYHDDLTPTAWLMVDHAIEHTLREAESAACFERVWDALFPHSHADAALRRFPHF